MGTKVLVASLDPKFSVLAQTDTNSYRKFYSNTAEGLFNCIGELRETICSGYEIVHLFSDVLPNGSIVDTAGETVLGSDLIKSCTQSGVKLLWVASANKAEGYIKGFNLSGMPMNLVMTISRSESNFPSFLENLLSKMSGGQPMPVAWVAIAPQTQLDPQHRILPECIFAAGRASVVLR
ncbi:MAG TPA: hypothetical protein VK788_19550 [Terriglobales bacterium]|nr:hypothetical protein [Terriglobales bacterium]